MSEPFPKRITQPFSHPFVIQKAGLYAITIVATCRSGIQTGQAGGEDLRVEIDGLQLREIPPVARTQLFNIPPTWNGSQLQDKPQTVIFILRLSKGDHSINFIPYRGAEILYVPDVKEMTDAHNLSFYPEVQADDSERQPWYVLALINLPLASLTIDATAYWRWFDSDDIKLIVDGTIKTNSSSFLRRQWLWAGSILKKLSQNERQEKTFTENLPQGDHYIELWADRMPILHKIKIELGDMLVEEPQSKTHMATVTDPGEGIKEVNLRSEATTLKGQILTIIPLGERINILEERVRSQLVAGHSNIWHKVSYQGQEGYILSSYVDIDGQTTEDIKRLIVATAKETGINPEYVLALAECESHFKPYAVSEDQAKGVMQITDLLTKDLNNPDKAFYSPIDDVFSIEQNIRAGVAYFSYLYKRYQRSPDQLSKAIVAYNAGPSLVPLGKPLDLSLYDPQAGRLVQCILNHHQKRTFKNIISLLLAGIALAGVGQYMAFQYALDHEPRVLSFKTDNSRTSVFVFDYPPVEDHAIERISATSVSDEPFIWETHLDVFYKGKEDAETYILPGYLINAYFIDIAIPGSERELVLERQEGQLVKTTVLRYNQDKSTFYTTDFFPKDGPVRQEACCIPLAFVKVSHNNVEHNPVMAGKVFEFDSTYNLFVEKD